MGIVALLLYLLGIHMAYYGYAVFIAVFIEGLAEEDKRLGPILQSILHWAFVLCWPLTELISLVTMKNNKE